MTTVRRLTLSWCVVATVWGVAGVAILLLWGIMALMSMVWVHDTVLNCIAQDGILN